MIAEMMIKKAAGDGDGANSVLESLCRRLVGIPLSLVRRTSPERLLDLIHAGGKSNFNAIVLAELLLLDVELSDKSANIPQATECRLQAFCLLVDSIDLLGPEEQAEYRKKLDILARDLQAISDAPYVRSKIESYLSKRSSV